MKTLLSPFSCIASQTEWLSEKLIGSPAKLIGATAKLIDMWNDGNTFRTCIGEGC